MFLVDGDVCETLLDVVAGMLAFVNRFEGELSGRFYFQAPNNPAATTKFMNWIGIAFDEHTVMYLAFVVLYLDRILCFRRCQIRREFSDNIFVFSLQSFSGSIPSSPQE